MTAFASSQHGLLGQQTQQNSTQRRQGGGAFVTTWSAQAQEGGRGGDQSDVIQPEGGGCSAMHDLGQRRDDNMPQSGLQKGHWGVRETTILQRNTQTMIGSRQRSEQSNTPREIQTAAQGNRAPGQLTGSCRWQRWRCQG